ncbi:MAG: hypothetical protein U1E81_05940 [Xanthobacteraceae bacterium]
MSGLEATHAAIEESKRGPICLEPADDRALETEPARLAALADARPPPRVRKPHPNNDRFVAPLGVDLESLRGRLREAFGNTLSDEFVQVMMRKLMDALAPSPHDELGETALNAGLAIINSMQPQSELEALLAVQIVATGFSGLRFLRDSHRQMTNDFINVYGGYAERLLRLQNDLIRAFDRHRRGNRQTVEVRHVHLHSGAQGVIGIVNHENNHGGEDQPK